MLGTIVESVFVDARSGHILTLALVLLAIRKRFTINKLRTGIRRNWRSYWMPSRPVQVAPDRPPTPIESHEWRDGGLQTPVWRAADPEFRFEFEKHFSPKNGLYPYRDVREAVYLEFLFTVETRQARSFADLSRLLLVQFVEGGVLHAAPVLNQGGVGCLETYVRRRSRLLDNGAALQESGRFRTAEGGL